MIVFLSPAKLMNQSPVVDAALPAATPLLFPEKTAVVVAALLQLSVEELMQQLGINRELAGLNYMRYREFAAPDRQLKPAVLAYDGVVYRKLDASTLSASAFEYAQDHLLIGSPLYGLLRPLDGLMAYRAAFALSLPGLPGTLYHYWRPVMTMALAERACKQGNVIVDLSSQEISRAIDWKKIGANIEVIRPVFMENRPNGRFQTLAIYAKQARGSMARFLVDERISDPDDLPAFAADGYYYNNALSTRREPVFTR